MKITLIAHTRIVSESMKAKGWEPDPYYDNASALSEFAGRACYQSWSRPNPQTATNDGYLRNILTQEHFSVLEHGSVSFYIEDVSRSLTHELVRHRHLSYSQLSQRYVMPGDNNLVVPPLYRDAWSDTNGPFPMDDTQRVVEDVWNHAIQAYDKLVAMHMPRLIQAGMDERRARKKAREAARCVLPNMTPTAIVVSGNHRSWREFLAKRGSIHADAEIRLLAFALFDKLTWIESALYQDFRVDTDGEDKWLTNEPLRNEQPTKH